MDRSLFFGILIGYAVAVVLFNQFGGPGRYQYTQSKLPTIIDTRTGIAKSFRPSKNGGKVIVIYDYKNNTATLQ